MTISRTRRNVLRLAGTSLGSVGLAGFAGCLGSDPNQGDDTTGKRLEDHPAAREIDSQPFEGPQPGDAPGTIVAFEDPSCRRCRAFEQGTVPEIRTELTGTGKATFVFRGYPIVFPWGDPACHALEATFAESTSAHFALKGHYYANQDSFSEDDVLAKTKRFLDENTDVDAGAVVEAVENGDTEAAVQTDLDAGKAAGASTTPTIFLFRDGKFQTKAQGSVSFSTIEAALGQ